QEIPSVERLERKVPRRVADRRIGEIDDTGQALLVGVEYQVDAGDVTVDDPWRRRGNRGAHDMELFDPPERFIRQQLPDIADRAFEPIAPWIRLVGEAEGPSFVDG